jgi:hypothetical protein
MTFRFRFVSKDWVSPGYVTGTRVLTEFCLGLRRRRFGAASLARRQNSRGACAVPTDVSKKVRRIFARNVWESGAAHSVS